ncbi:MAG: N-acetyltransferase [Alphaproteobacteria bacterium]|nr:N-acetyltransferase [Alphaproteobacteria bacterium]
MSTLSSILVRDSTEGDVPAIHAIYSHHVLHGLASFEETPPDVAEMAHRRAEIVKRALPHLVATRDGVIIGYAYVGPFRPRSAYRYTLEDSIYVSPGAQRLGVGRRLLAELLHRSSAAGYRQMVAVIGDSANHASIGLHAALGFAQVGCLRSVGFKFGRWVDSVLMERALGSGDTTLPAG